MKMLAAGISRLGEGGTVWRHASTPDFQLPPKKLFIQGLDVLPLFCCQEVKHFLLYRPKMHPVCRFIRLISGLLILLTGIGAVNAAQASMVFCNRTHGPVEAALGYRDSDGWVSEGWWKIQPGQCARVLGGTLTQRFYFYYARALTSPYRDRPPFTWSGKYQFCTGVKAFHIQGDADCDAKGYIARDFQQIDLGGTVRDYTLDFKDNNER